jgi:RNA-binding protein YhbY
MSSSVFQRKDIPVVNVGKKGLDESVLEEIRSVLQSRGMVKVKLLKNFRETYGLTPEEAGSSDLAEAFSRDPRSTWIRHRLKEDQ